MFELRSNSGLIQHKDDIDQKKTYDLMKPQKYNLRSPKKSIFTLNPCFLLLQLITGYKHRICFFFLSREDLYRRN